MVSRNSKNTMQTLGKLFKKNLFWIPLILLTVWTLMPMVWTVLASFKDPLELYESPRFLPQKWQLNSYHSILVWPGFSRWVANSVIVTFVSTISAVSLSILAAYGISRYAFKGRHLLLLLFLLPRILPRVSIVVPLFDLLVRLNLINTFSALFITYTASAIPLATWILVGFFAAVPKELEEAAEIDGGNIWHRLRYVMIPVAWPGVLTVGILSMREGWNEFPFVLTFMSSSEMRTLPYQLYQFKDAMGFQDWTLYSAFTVLTILPLLLVYIRLEKHVVASMTSGALK